MGMNHITVVTDDDSIAPQARTYAEYRVFAVLARHIRNLRPTQVVIRQTDEAASRDRVTCEVTVGLESSGPVRIRATGPHAYAAINRAAERLATALRRVEQRLSL